MVRLPFWVLLALVGACAHTRGGPPEGPPGGGAGADGQPAPELAWGLRASVGDRLVRKVQPDRLFLSSMGQAPLTEGSFELTIRVDPRGAEVAPRTLAAAAREAWPGAQVAATAEASFLGLPAAAFTFSDGRTQGLHVVAVSGHCVIELVVLRDGPPEALTQAASQLLGHLHPEPADRPLSPPPCR